MDRVLSWIKICELPDYSWLVIGEMWVSLLVKVSRLSVICKREENWRTQHRGKGLFWVMEE